MTEKIRTRPEFIGRFRVIRELGAGATGDVYLCEDPDAGEQVAVKLQRPLDSGNPDSVIHARMFARERGVVGMLTHPNVLRLHEGGEEDGLSFLVMTFIPEADTLASLCAGTQRLDLESVVAMVFKLASALQHTHSRGVIHCDVKPANIMVTSERDVRLIDFGIAQYAGAPKACSDTILGSPFYMSPEQIQGHELTPATDLYALAAVTYELLTGKRPFRAKDLEALMQCVVEQNPLPIRELRPETPWSLVSAVNRALSKDPAKRQPNCLEFADDLAKVFLELRSQNRLTWGSAGSGDPAGDFHSHVLFPQLAALGGLSF